MALVTVWLEIIRVVVGLLVLLALSTLYRLFKDTKVVRELNLIILGFALFSIQAALGAYAAYGNDLPIIWKLRVDDFIEALMYIVFAVAIIRLKAIFDWMQMEDKLFKAIRSFIR